MIRTENQIANLSERIAAAVVRTGVVTHDNVRRAETVIRAEIKALLRGDRYATEREAIMLGSVSDAAVIGIVVMECVSKIRG